MSLTFLPAELVENIAAYLDLSAFRSLRLACAKLRHQSRHVFRDRFFRNRSVHWTLKDLDRLVEVANNTDFGHALQHLRIDATPRHSISLWKIRKNISEADAIFSELNSVLFKSELQEQYIKQEEEARDLATFFNETRYDQKCLHTIFTKVKELEGITFKYEGMDKKYGKFGRRYCEASQNEMSRPFISTLAAIAESGIYVRMICADAEYNHGAVSIGRLESLAPLLPNFDSAFEKLEKLELNLRDWRYPDIDFELENTRAPFVVRFLAKTYNVKHLRLSFYSSLDDNLFGQIALHCTFSRLETCSLADFRLHNACDVYKFLTPSYPTLKDLTFSHITLRDPEITWPDLLRQFASSDDTVPALERLTLRQVFTRTGSRIQVSSSGCDIMRLDNNGEETWRDCLPYWFQGFRESTSGPAWHLGATAYPFSGMKT